MIREAYRIDGITLPECRSIFLDWALSLPETRNQKQALTDLHGAYVEQAPDHPMTQVLAEGLQATHTPKRRGGWRSRNR
ncbi:hypothetical protein RKLH11_1855 [Rhodobacteraceae bacterium KLH11]|nr:hypothetical protein RKLH11_1855 [Rhodobacteraceae bacterium KLH11]